MSHRHVMQGASRNVRHKKQDDLYIVAAPRQFYSLLGGISQLLAELSFSFMYFL